MEILYCGNYCGQTYQKKVSERHKFFTSTAQEKIEGLILEGLSADKKIHTTVISSVQVNSYPGHSKLCWPNLYQSKANVDFIHVPFINILLVKQICMMFSSAYFALKWFWKNRKIEDKVLLSYATNLPVLLPNILMAKLFSTKSVVIVSEIPRFRMFYGQSSPLRKLLLRLMVAISTRIHDWFDGFVVLSEAMNEEINRAGKPSICVEGMVDSAMMKSQVDYNVEKNTDHQVFLYSGSLNKKYGFEQLITAFREINNENIRLWIIGTGDYEEEIKKICNEDNRIRFLGLLENNHVLQLQKNADFLVNPRPSHEQYTKYSFPSKTLEYMVSGTPAISTNLPGIPSDYAPYLIFFENESVQGMKSTLEKVLQWTRQERIHFGEAAKKFVISEKNNQSQCSRIINLLRMLIAKR